MMIKDTQLNWTLNRLARVFVGLVFLFSSFVKGVDPMGTAFKITEYLTTWSFFGMSFEWLEPMASVMSMALIVAEFTVGMMMLFGCFRQLSAWLLVLMMLFFTSTTLYDAITNEVTDCGCFGDAIKLTNWQTFWKNIVLDVPAAWILLTCNLRRKKRFERDVMVTVFAILMMVIFGLYNINHEPCIDFRAWKVGNQMVEMDENLEVKSYVTYRNTSTGETDEFEASELVAKMADPAWEQQWEWESSRVEDPHQIKADGFSMLDMDQNDHAQELVASEDYLLIATIHHLGQMSEDGVATLRHVAEFAESNNLYMVILSSALPEDMEAFLHANKLDSMEFYFADVTAIETMTRSNPGFVLMKEGKVQGKWHYKHVGGLVSYDFE